MSLGGENASSLKSSHDMTRSSLSSTLSGVGLCVMVCVHLWLPVSFPFPCRAPSASWQCVCESVLSTALSLPRILFIASLWNVLTSSLQLPSHLSLPEALLHLPGELHCYFWKIPNSQGALCVPSLCPSEKQPFLCVSNYNSWMEPQDKRQNPLLPRDRPAPGWLSLSVGLGSLGSLLLAPSRQSWSLPL